MADDFLSGILGNNTQQDFASPLQVAIAKALMEKSAPEQMKYDPTIPGGWKASVVNALGNINSAMYRNQALRVNQGIIGNNARTATNLVVRPQDKQPAIRPSVVMKEPADTAKPGPWDTKVFPNDGTGGKLGSDGMMNLGAQPNSGNWDWEGLPIVNGIDEKAPYMGRKRDEANTKRIVFHGDLKDNVNDVIDANGDVKNQGLLNYGRSVDKKRGFDPNYHFYIDRDGTVTQGVPLDRSANHVGTYNKDSIGIVLAGVVGGKEPTLEQRKSATMLSERLAKQYGLSQSNVFSHPELQPGHREPSEASDVAANIRKFGFGQDSVKPSEPSLDEASEQKAAIFKPPLSRGGISPEQLAAQAQTRQMGNPSAANMSIPGVTEISKNVLPNQGAAGGISEIAKNVMPQGPGVTDIAKMALGAGNAPMTKDPSQIPQQDMGATPWSKAQEAAQAAQKGDIQQPTKQQDQYLPDEQREIDSPLRPESAIGRTRMAQMLPDKTGKPGVPQGGNWINIPGYSGPAPSVPSLPSEKSIAERIHALAISGDMDSVNEFVQDIQKKMQPQVVKVPNGELHITPKHYPDKNEITFMPTAETEPISAGGATAPIVTQFDKNGNLQYTVKAPGFANQTFDSKAEATNAWETYIDFAQRKAAEGEATGKIYEEKAGQVGEAVTQGQKANNALQRLNTMDALSKTGGAWTPAGPTKDTSLKIRQFLDNMGIPTKGTSEGEIFDKFNNFLASEATQAITSRGTNFDLETFMRANPSLLQSKEGREALIDVLKQEYKARQYIGRRANSLKGGDVDKLSGIVEEYYRNNPIKFKVKVGKGEKTINTYPVQDEKDVEDHIQSGEHFYGPSRKERYKP